MSNCQGLQSKGEFARQFLKVGFPAHPLPFFPFGFLLALGLSGLAFVIRWLLDPVLGYAYPLMPAFLAVALAGCFAGWRSGVLAMVTSHAWGKFFFTSPSTESLLGNRADAVSVLWFYITCAVLLLLISRMFKANQMLQDVVLRCQEADRRKTKFLAALSHELRNPLAAIRSSSDILKKMPMDNRGVAARDILGRQLVHITRLVNDLLDVSKIEQGKMVLDLRVIEVSDLVREAVEVSQPLTDAKQQTLSVKLPSQHVWIRADRTRMVQILGNLLHNASKFSPKGKDIALEVSVAEGSAVFTVRDAGMGIAKNDLPSIFSSFVQLESDNTTGLGLGLSLVSRLVTMHCGTVAAHSEGLGHGAEFKVCLPLDPQQAPAPAPAVVPGPAGPAAVAGPLKVLVIDDNQDAANAVAMLMDFDGHEVTVAATGEDGLVRALADTPDLVILDIGLPDMNGYEVLDRVRKEIVFSRQPLVVALTGWGADEVRQKTSEAGFDAYLAKPVEYALLASTIKKLTDRRDALRRLREGLSPRDAV